MTASRKILRPAAARAYASRGPVTCTGVPFACTGVLFACTGVLVMLCAVLLAGCGVRGQPRPPLRIAPAAITAPAATRLADRIYVEFTVPDRDTDGTTPGDIGWIEVYALTTQPTAQRPEEPFSEDWLEASTLVAVLPVRSPAAPPDAPLPALDDLLDEAQNRDAVRGPVAYFEVAQGEAATVVDRLTADALVPVVVGDPDEDEEEEDDEEDPGRILPQPLVSPPAPRPPVRSYVAFAVSSRGRPNDPTAPVRAPLAAPPAPPGPPQVTYTATAVQIAWEAPDTLRLPVQEEEEVEAPVLSSTPILPGLAPSEYVVHELAGSGDPDVVRPVQVGLPGRAETRTDTAVEFGETRCYAVRVLDRVGPPAAAAGAAPAAGPGAAAGSGLQLLGDASPATCVVLTDTFPPAAPTGLITVADAAGISLVWDGVADVDLAGYRVLRGTAPDATLQTLTPEPLVRTAYQDTDVTAGVRYFYQVLAVDTAVPPNASAPSEAVSEVAR